MPRARRAILLAIVVPVSLVVAVPAHSAEVDFSTWTPEQKADFLLTAEVVEMERLAIGVTKSKRVLLRHNGVEHAAHWQVVDVILHDTKIGNRRYFDFKDSYLFNIAAYQLDRLLGLDMVPVTVLRKLKGHGPGAMAWWVDDVQMMEKERDEKGIDPPDRAGWQRQIRRYHCFTQLIADADANATNLLITSDWRVWLIDFTRAFRTSVTIMDHPPLKTVDSELLAALAGLNKKEVRVAMAGVLERDEINALLRRRDRILTRLTEEPRKD